MNKILYTLLLFGIVLAVIYEILSSIFTVIVYIFPIIITVILIIFGIFIAYAIYSELYFRSKSFKVIKQSISEYTNNCNELNHYIEELKKAYLNIKAYNYGTGAMTDHSVYKFQRKGWREFIKSNQIHHCSATVCKNAQNQPIKYLCKYFDIIINEESLSKFEQILNNFLSVEQGRVLLQREIDSILMDISQSIPFLIKKYSNNRITRELGFEKVDISDTYIPTFTFQYISAGGNSSASCIIKLDIYNLNRLINYLHDKIQWGRSIAGQRALMTSQLRETIKERDNYKCCSCGLGVIDEPNLLLEIDHKIPLSKGGMTKFDNLQTLCWRCNRAKGAKMSLNEKVSSFFELYVRKD